MSVLKKVPYIQQIIGKLSAEQIAELLSEMNSTSEISNHYSLVNGDLFIPALEDDDDYLITACTVELERGKFPYTGFLLHFKSTSEYCVLIAYHRFQDIKIISIDRPHNTFEVINEYCDIDELRRVVENDAGADNAWVDKMKEVLDYDEEDEEVEVGTDLFVDGDIKLNSSDDFEVDGNLYQLVPDSLGHAGKYLKAGTTGLMWDTPTQAPYPIVEVQFTEADWNENEGYVKRINVNNCVLHITGIRSLTHNDNIWIYNKYLELLKNPFEYTGFYGITSDEEERAIYFEKSAGGYLQLAYPYILINNGIVSFLTDLWEL